MSAPGYCAEDVRVRQAMSTRKSDPAIAAATGWSGRFSEPVAELVKRYTASVDFDKRLADADIAGSLAHACWPRSAFSPPPTLPRSSAA
jgi:hypothetical protein